MHTCTHALKVGGAVLLLGCVAVIVPALTLDICQFKFEGIAGAVEDSIFSSTPALRQISLIALPGEVIQYTDNTVVAALADSALVICTIVAPLVCIVCWGISWGWTLSTGCNARAAAHPLVRAAVHTQLYAYSWCTLDVAWFAVCGNVMGIDLIVQWMVQKHPGVNKFCEELKSNSSIECVQMEAKLLEGSWFLLAAAVLTGALHVVSAKAFGLRGKI